MTNDDKIKAACKVEGCLVDELLHSRVDERRQVVVIVVGPVGYKYRVPFDDLTAAPPVTTKVEAENPPVVATAKRVAKRRRQSGKPAASKKA